MNWEPNFEEHRRYLFGIAYRMLGTRADAEDVLQDAFLRLQQQRETVESPRSYLATIVTRLSIDQLRSRKRRKEEYVGPWLPEPLIAHGIAAGSDPPDDSLSIAFLMILEKLSPTERAVFLLRQVFDYEYAEIARIVNKTEANVRQLFVRARKKIAQKPSRFSIPSTEKNRLFSEFIHACTTAELQPLISLLSEHITLYSDGGGKVTAAINPIHGPNAVARFVLGVLKKAPANFSYEQTAVNGEPAIITYRDGKLQSVLTADYDEYGICGIYIVVNPDKLRSQ